MSPSLLLSLVLASIYGLLFHSLVGRRLWQLPCYWITALAGFFLGELLATFMGASLLRLGNVPLAMASLVAWVALGVCWFFIAPLPESPATSSRDAAEDRWHP